MKLSAEYFLNKSDRFYLDSIEPWVFSLDKPYDYQMCDAMIELLVDSFLPKLISDFSDLYVYLELCDNYFYNGYHSNLLYFSDDPHRISLNKLDETSFPLVDYFFTLLYDLLSSASLTHGQYMDMIHRHLYASPHLPPRFRNNPYQKKLYPLDLIKRDMAAPAISSTFAFEDLSQDVLSVILSYADVSSARNMLLVGNSFYFGTRACLTRHGSVFEIYRTSFIEQLLPLFTEIKELNDKIDILEILCDIHSNSVHHALDPLSISNTFKPRKLKNSPFVQKFSDLIYGLYPFAPCISTREYYYLLRLFILPLLPSTISLADPLKPFELIILSNKFTFAHFLGYMNILLPLMKEENLMASALGLNENDLRSRFDSFGDWYGIRWARNDENIVCFIFA